MTKIDMSPEAVLRRLQTVDRLRELCLALKKAKKVPDAERHSIRTDMNSEEKPQAKQDDR